jgi:hypothetical protein
MAFWRVIKFLQCTILSRSRCCKQKSVENLGGTLGLELGHLVGKCVYILAIGFFLCACL